MTGTVSKGLAQRGDLDQYDGTLATSRTDSTGGTLTGLKIGNAVDILQVFGDGLTANQTQATVNKAITALTGTNIAFVFAPGSWTFSATLTIAANFTIIIPAGCTLEPASGKTLTLAGVVVREHATYTGGAGTVTISGTDTLAAQDTTTHYAADTGAADAYVMTPSPVVASYAAGQMYAFLAANANTGASTLNVSSLGTKAIQKYAGGALTDVESGDILASQIIHVRYDGTQFQLIPNIQNLNVITTRGDLIYGNSTPAAARLPIGSADQVLTSDGTDLAWGTPTAIDWELLATATASADATVNLASPAFDSTYHVYKVFIAGLVPASDDVPLYLRVGTGGTPTYQSGASDYGWAWHGHHSSSSLSGSDNADSEIELTNTTTGGVGTGANEDLSGEITIYDPSNTGFNTLVTWNIIHRAADATTTIINGGGQYISDTAVTAVQFLMSSGNIASGEFRLYGLRDA